MRILGFEEVKVNGSGQVGSGHAASETNALHLFEPDPSDR